MADRIIVLLDMDCFYVQVEERHYPHIKGIPAAVVQYNSWKGGAIIAVNYEARAFGVNRGMRGEEARSKCPNIELVTVPVNRGKADLTRYRDAGKEVINVLCDFSDCVERASIDEAYIEFTGVVQERLEKFKEKLTSDKLKSTWVVGYDEVTGDVNDEEKEEIRKKGVEEWLSSVYGAEEDAVSPLDNTHPQWGSIKLAHIAVLCEEMRAAVLERTGFKCSAGIAHNKMLGKLCCGLHKPNQQTLIPQCKVESLWLNMPVGKVRNLGGKLGDTLIEELSCNTMGDLSKFSLQQLMGRYDNKTAQWLYNLGKGIDNEAVTSRQLPKSIGCGKNFQGKETLNTREKVQKWMFSLAEELNERLDEDQASNKRRAKTLTVSVRLDGDARFTSISRSSNLPSYCADRITRVSLSLIQHTNKAPAKNPSWIPAIKNISLSAGKFEDWTGSGSGDIQEMFKKAQQNPKNNVKRLEQDGGEVLSNSEICRSDQPNTDDAQKADTVKLDTSLNGNDRFKTSPNKNETFRIGTDKNIRSKVSPNKTKKSKKSPNNNNKSKKSPNNNNKSKTDSLVSNSFFRNLLQKREVQKTKVLEPVPSEVSNGSGVDVIQSDCYRDESDALNCSKSDEEDNLDMLVSFLSDDDEPVDGNDIVNSDMNVHKNESDGSCYDAATDIDSSFSSEVGKQVQQSPDLFAEDQSSRDTFSPENSNESDKKGESDNSHVGTLIKQVISSGAMGCVSVVTNGRESVEEFIQNGSSLKFDIPENIRKSEGNISVAELFPDLDNIDESVLSMLPKELKLEVEKSLKDHKAKSRQRKSGLWKYVTTVPSPQKMSISKSIEMISEPQAGPSRNSMTIDENSPKGSKCVKLADENSHLNSGETSICKVTVDDDSQCDVQDMVECEVCGLKISAFEVIEHADYHVALSLQTNMKNEASVSNSKKVEKYSAKSNRGKKRNKVNSKASFKDSKHKKIDSYFRS